MILKIARMGHSVLREVASPVHDPSSPEVASLVKSMIETMEDVSGAGLAAPQVHVSLRIVIFHVPPQANGEEPVPLTVLVNPKSPLSQITWRRGLRRAFRCQVLPELFLGIVLFGTAVLIHRDL